MIFERPLKIVQW